MKRTNIRNILVPIDFSKMSGLAIETAQRLATRFAATAHLVHVRHFYYPADLTAPVVPIAPSLSVTYDRESEQRAARQLNALAKKRGLAPVICHVLTGAPVFDEICRLAKEIPADLIVMPTHGHTGLKHVFLGSTAERVVQHSPCPVFVARKSERQSKTGPGSRINRILVPVDFSDCSLDGLNYAIAFADRVAAKLILFHAVQLAPYTSGGFAYDLSSLEEAAQKDAERQMRAFVRMAKFGRVKFETAIRTGVPVREIAAFAKEQDADLIITSTHGRTGFSHVLIGSVAENIVRHAPCSVLVVPSHPQERAKHLVSRADRTRKLPRSKGRQTATKQMPHGTRRLTRRVRKIAAHSVQGRRKTNKFRESHSATAIASR
jgi:nucleotide-binding universal stress UspA family protein